MALYMSQANFKRLIFNLFSQYHVMKIYVLLSLKLGFYMCGNLGTQNQFLI